MSLFWLKAVPWSTIISNAPIIVDGAKKLASLVRSKPGAARPVATARAGSAVTDTTNTLAMLEARLHALEEQQQEAADLLRALADNNVQMARAIEALHRRVKLSLRIAAAAALGALMLVAWLASH